MEDNVKLKKLLLIGLLISLMVLTTGCWIYGKGETVGYVYAVDDGLIWDKVWYKSSLDSSESDCYLIKDDVLKEELKQLTGNNYKLKLYYDRHIITLGMCPEGTTTEDEITGFEVLN